MTSPTGGLLRWGFRSAGSIAAIAADTYICSRIIVVNPITVGFLYLVTILLIATKWGWVEAVAASVAATLCYNFFSCPLLGTLRLPTR